MTTRAERLDHIRLYINAMLNDWEHKHAHGVKEAVKKDPRLTDAIGLIADVLGDMEGADDGVGLIEDVTFIEDEEASDG